MSLLATALMSSRIEHLLSRFMVAQFADTMRSSVRWGRVATLGRVWRCTFVPCATYDW
jgi:hypothetical protein